MIVISHKVLEIKCPFMYRKSLKMGSAGKDFPIDPIGKIRRKCQYYFQIQPKISIIGVC